MTYVQGGVNRFDLMSFGSLCSRVKQVSLMGGLSEEGFDDQKGLSVDRMVLMAKGGR